MIYIHNIIYRIMIPNDNSGLTNPGWGTPLPPNSDDLPIIDPERPWGTSGSGNTAWVMASAQASLG